ncbi:MAG: phosphoribosylformylglycinamidine cyclo-ligase, partial [Cyanobacteria bacterium NC_groundwater_1444_Ag_S-0.65um_54_12]|nr:phosphoribosylformylglycinamidine cyclo-ligase [Cyanobacteria bacterium NC_groundwater_1444_Ag_S-0.65um_54_12]
RLTYQMAGVDVEAGNEFVRRIQAQLPAIGGFSGLFPIDEERLLVASTDGVGTKLELALASQSIATIGIDLVAMVVNDLVTCGARPLFFLDYFATGKLELAQAEQVISGIIQGCREADCQLLGGETAEMPGFYPVGKFDLAGFGVGLVTRSNVIDGRNVVAGDLILGLPSSGPHANGYSLIRKILQVKGHALEQPFGVQTLGETLLTPTRIYVKEVLALCQHFEVHAIAHLTGGGFSNVNRVIPEGLQARIDFTAWPLPPIFTWLQEAGNISPEEMRRTFNLGIGMVLIVPPGAAEQIRDAHGQLLTIGEVKEA